MHLNYAMEVSPKACWLVPYCLAAPSRASGHAKVRLAHPVSHFLNSFEKKRIQSWGSASSADLQPGERRLRDSGDMLLPAATPRLIRCYPVLLCMRD